jgi:hypothetical protein
LLWAPAYITKNAGRHRHKSEPFPDPANAKHSIVSAAAVAEADQRRIVASGVAVGTDFAIFLQLPLVFE